MFLVLGPMHNEPIWRAFLEASQGLHINVRTKQGPKVNLTTMLHGGFKPPMPKLPDNNYIHHRTVRPALLEVQKPVAVNSLVDKPYGVGSQVAMDDIRKVMAECQEEHKGQLEEEIDRLMAGGKCIYGMKPYLFKVECPETQFGGPFLFP